MAFFKSKTLSQSIEAARANRDRLAGRLSESEQSVIDAKTLAQNCALSGDDDGQYSAEVAEGTALRRLSTTAAAHAEATALVTKLEAEQAALVDKKTRTATAAEVAELATALEANSLELRTALEKTTALTKRAALFIPEAAGVNVFTESSGQQIGPAIELVTMLMRNHATAVLDGSAPAVLPTPEKPFVPTIRTKPVTVPVFATRAIKWTDGEGQTRYIGRYRDADLPPELAARALSLKVCVPIDDPMRRKLKGSWPAPNPAQCLSLDDPGAVVAEPAANEPVQFERVNRGPAYQLRVAAGGAS